MKKPLLALILAVASSAMAVITNINIGSYPGDEDADTIYEAFDKVNHNFQWVTNNLGSGSVSGTDATISNSITITRHFVEGAWIEWTNTTIGGLTNCDSVFLPNTGTNIVISGMVSGDSFTNSCGDSVSKIETSSPTNSGVGWKFRRLMDGANAGGCVNSNLYEFEIVGSYSGHNGTYRHVYGGQFDRVGGGRSFYYYEDGTRTTGNWLLYSSGLIPGLTFDGKCIGGYLGSLGYLTFKTWNNSYGLNDETYRPNWYFVVSGAGTTEVDGVYKFSFKSYSGSAPFIFSVFTNNNGYSLYSPYNNPRNQYYVSPFDYRIDYGTNGIYDVFMANRLTNAVSGGGALLPGPFITPVVLPGRTNFSASVLGTGGAWFEISDCGEYVCIKFLLSGSCKTIRVDKIVLAAIEKANQDCGCSDSYILITPDAVPAAVINGASASLCFPCIIEDCP